MATVIEVTLPFCEWVFVSRDLFQAARADDNSDFGLRLARNVRDRIAMFGAGESVTVSLKQETVEWMVRHMPLESMFFAALPGLMENDSHPPQDQSAST